MLRLYPLSGIAEGSGILAPNGKRPRRQAALGRRSCIAEQLNPGFLLGLVAMVSRWIVSGSIVAPAVGHDLAPKPFRQMPRASAPYAVI
jgi:hypothetical protein